MSSSPAPAPARPSLGISKSHWILGPWQDLALVVGTPLLIVPLVLAGRQAFSTAELYLFVASFGALGHHLPGMMRAYGDRALFRRFRVRFIVAPIFLAATCLAFASWSFSPILLVVFAWGVWHGFMQAYGFMRIYDAKAGFFDAVAARLDWLMVLTWFGLAVLWSPLRMAKLLGHLYDSGVPHVPLAGITALRWAWLALTAVVTVAFVVHLARCWRAGRAPSPLKLLLLVTSIGFWVWCNLFVGSLLIAILLFEVFHDVQYLTIVWMFNRRRVESDPDVGGFTRFVFRQRGLLVVLYLGLIFAYGSLNVVMEKTETSTFKTALAALLAASALLHFYYDGFIWKVRERGTSKALGIAGKDGDGDEPGPRLPGWTAHGLKWSLLVVPLLLLATLRVTQGPMPQDDRILALAEVSPDDAVVQYNLATLMYRRGELDEAIEANRRATALPSDSPDVHERARRNLFGVLMERAQSLVNGGRKLEALPLLHEAAGMEPGLARELGRRTAQTAQAGNLEAARVQAEMAVMISPDDPTARRQLAEVLRRLGRPAEAREHARRAERLGVGGASSRATRSASASPPGEGT